MNAAQDSAEPRTVYVFFNIPHILGNVGRSATEITV